MSWNAKICTEQITWDSHVFFFIIISKPFFFFMHLALWSSGVRLFTALKFWDYTVLDYKFYTQIFWRNQNQIYKGSVLFCEIYSYFIIHCICHKLLSRIPLLRRDISRAMNTFCAVTIDRLRKRTKGWLVCNWMSWEAVKKHVLEFELLKQMLNLYWTAWKPSYQYHGKQIPSWLTHFFSIGLKLVLLFSMEYIYSGYCFLR